MDDAREQIAGLLGVDLGERGVHRRRDRSRQPGRRRRWEPSPPPIRAARPPALVCSAMEHHAVLYTCRALARRPGPSCEVPTGKDGIVDLEALAEACTPDVGLVSVMTVNNEIGTVQPIDAVASVVREGSPSAVLHTDAVQAVPWIDMRGPYRPRRPGGGQRPQVRRPKGVGALVVRAGSPSDRSSTGAARSVSAGAAPTTWPASWPWRRPGGAPIARRRWSGWPPCATGWGTGCWPRWPARPRPGAPSAQGGRHLHLRFAGVEGEALVVVLDEAGVAVSAGAACSSGAVEVSHVLTSMGLGPDEAASGIRFSLGSTTTDAEIDHALAVVPDAVAQLRD